MYIAKLPKPQAGGKNKKINYSITHWQRGYIKKRIEQKCREQSVELVEVFGKDISRECSQCGRMSAKKEGRPKALFIRDDDKPGNWNARK